jgi:hypothetical protein
MAKIPPNAPPASHAKMRQRNSPPLAQIWRENPLTAAPRCGKRRYCRAGLVLFGLADLT